MLINYLYFKRGCFEINFKFAWHRPHWLQSLSWHEFPRRAALSQLDMSSDKRGVSVCQRDGPDKRSICRQFPKMDSAIHSKTQTVYRDALKDGPQVGWIWVKKWDFVYLLQAGKHNFFTLFSHNLVPKFEFQNLKCVSFLSISGKTVNKTQINPCASSEGKWAVDIGK